jgi:hypothetical protein
MVFDVEEMYFAQLFWINYGRGRRVFNRVLGFSDGAREERVNVPWLVAASLEVAEGADGSSISICFI